MPKPTQIVAFCGISILWLIVALEWPGAAGRRDQHVYGLDFTQFYTVAHLPLTSLYSQQAVIGFGERELKPVGVHYYPPYLRPAVFVLLLRPLAWFGYWPVFYAWAALNFAAYAAALYLLFRRFGLPWALLPAFALFAPAVLGIVFGQDIAVYLLVLLGGLLLLLQGKDVAAGLLFALCAYKFHLLLFLPLVLFFKRRPRALVAFTAGVALEAIASALLVSPFEYVSVLRTNGASLGYPGGLRSMVSALGHPHWYHPLALVIAVACAYFIWRLPCLQAFCVAIAGALFVGYHVVSYDCLLLAIPLASAWRQGGNASRAAIVLVLVTTPLWAFDLAQAPAAAELVAIASCTASAWPKNGRLLIPSSPEFSA